MKRAKKLANDKRIKELYRKFKSGRAIARKLHLTPQGANKALRRLKLR
jgi:hypothetical protein